MTRPARHPTALTPSAAAVEILVPEAALVVLLGPAGAGKSTFARRWFTPDEILSSDELRALISGDPADQSVSPTAFAILHRQLARRLTAGLTTVIDATNVRHGARRSLLTRARRVARPAVAIVLDLPRGTVHERNAARLERVVERAIVDAQLAALARTLALGQLAAEGFVAVHVLSSVAEVDAVQVVRPGTGVR
jgi:protein phosphatase